VTFGYLSETRGRADVRTEEPTGAGTEGMTAVPGGGRARAGLILKLTNGKGKRQAPFKSSWQLAVRGRKPRLRDGRPGLRDGIL